MHLNRSEPRQQSSRHGKPLLVNVRALACNSDSTACRPFRAGFAQDLTCTPPYRWRTCLRIASTMTSTAPAQMHAKHTACALVNGSPSTRTPERRLIVGLMYWMNPISESGVLFAAVANRMSGTAVIGQHQKDASLPCLKRHIRREKHALTSNSHCNESHDCKRQRNDSLDCNGGDCRVPAALLHRSVYAERKGENQGYPGKTAVVYREIDDARCRQYRSCNLQRRQTFAEYHEPQDNRYERVDVVSQRRLHHIVRHHSNDVEAPVQHDEKPRGNKESPCAGVS